MKKLRRLNKFLLFIIVCIFGIYLFQNITLIGDCTVKNNLANRFEMKRHIPSLSDDFKNDTVIVTLSSDYSYVNKDIDIDDFKTNNIIDSSELCDDFNIESSNKIIIENIRDLTYINDPSRIINKDEFCQVLSISLKSSSKQTVLDAIKELEKLDFVLAAEPSYNYHSVSDEVPDDYLYDQQWGLDDSTGINMESAWNFSFGDTSPRIRVGIFENNIQSDHPDLRVIPGNFSPDEDKSANHGTHVAGIIGAVSNNGKGVAGIAQVEIALLDRSNFVESLTWAFNNNIHVVNASFYYIVSKDDDTPAQANVAHENAVKIFSSNGGIIVCSAGNNGNNSYGNTDNTPQFPAGYGDSRYYPEIDNVISVGSLNSLGDRSLFSNYGTNSVHIYAPGQNILSTFPEENWGNIVENYNQIQQGYAKTSGTSMAAPHVTGVAALLLSLKPDLTVSQIKNAILSNSEIIDINLPDGTSQSVRKLNASRVIKKVLQDYSNSLSLDFNTRDLTGVIDASSNDYFNKNILVKLDVQRIYDYEFLISSQNALSVNFYDANLNPILLDVSSTNNNTLISFNKHLSLRVYYLKIHFQDMTLSGNVNVQIIGEEHMHDYGEPFEWLNYSQHTSSCSCGDIKYEPHAILKGNTTCIKCKGKVNTGFIEITSLSSPSKYVTENGSYILSNGVLVLVVEDVEKYMLGTLQFNEEKEILTKK